MNEQKSRPRKVKRSRRANGRKQSRRGTPSNFAPEPTGGSVTRSGFAVKAMPFFGYKIRKRLPCYISSTGLTSGASAVGSYVISANGMYDPDITGTGPQPMSFDQAMTFFNHYTVHSSTIRVTIQSNSASLRASVGLFVSGSGTPITSIEQLVENGDG